VLELLPVCDPLPDPLLVSPVDPLDVDVVPLDVDVGTPLVPPLPPELLGAVAPLDGVLAVPPLEVSPVLVV
jgi:hypothetical protein